jgi:hypothetical protein
MREVRTVDGRILHMPDEAQRPKREMDSACSCHLQMGNDFYFLPIESCLRADGRCDKHRDARPPDWKQDQAETSRLPRETLTPLMMSVLTFRYAHTSNVPYREFSFTALSGALLDLQGLGLVVADQRTCDYTLTAEGRAHVEAMQKLELPYSWRQLENR